MAFTPEQKQALAQQLAEKRAVLGESGFTAYVNKLDKAIPQAREQQIENTVGDLGQPSETKGLLGKISRFTGVDALARGAAAALNSGRNLRQQEEAAARSNDLQQKLVQQIRTAREAGRDTSRLEQALQREIDTSTAFGQAFADNADLGVSNREVIGSAIRTAGTIASAGTFGGGATGRLSTIAAPKLTSATAIGRGVLQGAGAGIRTGATSGAIFGGVSGVATGIEEDRGMLGTALETAKQAAFGGIAGGAIGGVVGGIGGAFQARSNRANELKELLSGADNVDDALAQASITTGADDIAVGADDVTNATKKTNRATAGFKVENGKVKPDKPAQALLRQGIPDTDVAIMQSMSDADKAAAKEMVKIAKEVSDTGIPTKRQQEIVGQSFMKRAKDVEKLNSTAGRQIDNVARQQLAGVKVNAISATDDFFNQLERAGVDVDTLRLADTSDDISRAFDGSDFEGITQAQKAIKTILKRVDPALDGADLDGMALHRAKRFIYNQVEYGKSSEGLTGQAENLLKGLAKNIDDVLDNQFPDYAAANTQYKDTIEALGEMRRIIGRDYLGSQDIANLRAGEVMNRLLGNASARPLSALQNLENTARKYGSTYNDSIIKQVRFADLLDDIYETVPKGSLQGRVAGGVAQGIDQGAGFLNRMRQGGFISASLDTAADIAKGAAGITPEARQKAVEEFLGLATK